MRQRFKTQRMINHDGERLSVFELASRHGMSHQLLRHRLKVGWKKKEALETPVKQYSK